jgi:hypothetical protein
MKRDPVNERIGQGGYVSEFEQYLNVFLASHPEVEADKKRGWNIWWDRKVDANDPTLQGADAVPAKAYKYY